MCYNFLPNLGANVCSLFATKNRGWSYSIPFSILLPNGHRLTRFPIFNADTVKVYSLILFAYQIFAYLNCILLIAKPPHVLPARVNDIPHFLIIRPVQRLAAHRAIVDLEGIPRGRDGQPISPNCNVPVIRNQDSHQMVFSVHLHTASLGHLHIAILAHCFSLSLGMFHVKHSWIGGGC